jgi:hypothetical protein
MSEYFDTDPMMRWAESLVANPIDRSSKIGGVVVGLIESAAITAISQITLIELYNLICTYRRGTDASMAQYDDAWIARVEHQLMSWIAGHRLQVLPPSPKAFQEAIRLVVSATTEHGRKFKAWDALHLYEAAQWSRRVGAKVSLYTSDPDFSAFLGLYPAFAEFVTIVDPAQ